jgi:hypothetical protein
MRGKGDPVLALQLARDAKQLLAGAPTTAPFIAERAAIDTWIGQLEAQQPVRTK